VGEQYANMVMLGAFVNRTRQVRFSTMVENMDIILGKGKAKFKDKNIEALRVGYEFFAKEK
jgi:Pyruvate/2-oxoacid:ferredoxin oxidoreductase gamma subunit